MAFDGVDQGARFPGHERAGAAVNGHVEIESRAENVGPQEPVLARTVDGHLRVLPRQRILLPHVDEAFRGADGIRPDDQPFEHAVRIAFEQAAVHVCARVAFVSVDDHVLRSARRLARSLPLIARREARPSAAAQIGLRHFLNHAIGRHLVKRLRQRRVTAYPDVIEDAGRIDQDVVFEQDALLIFVERNLRRRPHALAGFVVQVQQPRDDFVAEHGLFDDRGNVLHLRMQVADAFRLDHHQRTAFAEAVAAGAPQPHLAAQAALHNLVLKPVGQAFRAVRAAAGSRTHRDPHRLCVLRRQVFGSQVRQVRGSSYARHGMFSSFAKSSMIFSSFFLLGS